MEFFSQGLHGMVGTLLVERRRKRKRFGTAMHGNAMQCNARHGTARRGAARHGTVVIGCVVRLAPKHVITGEKVASN